MDELPVIGGRVRCPDRGWIDFEACLGCPALRSVQGGRRPRVLRCVSPGSRRTATPRGVGSFADAATLP